jgi:hypothetical protein
MQGTNNNEQKFICRRFVGYRDTCSGRTSEVSEEQRCPVPDKIFNRPCTRLKEHWMSKSATELKRSGEVITADIADFLCLLSSIPKSMQLEQISRNPVPGNIGCPRTVCWYKSGTFESEIWNTTTSVDIDNTFLVNVLWIAGSQYWSLTKGRRLELKGPPLPA